jgi:thiol-disulfide isomerase/thioredoxin
VFSTETVDISPGIGYNKIKNSEGGNKMLKKILAAMLALSLLAGCAENKEEPTAPQEAPKEEVSEESTEENVEELKGPFEVFSTEDVNGNPVTNEIFADYDMTVINIWGTFCGPCINEMPALGALAKEYAEKNVLFMGLVGDVINNDGSISEGIVEDARNIIADTGADYLHVLPKN